MLIFNEDSTPIILDNITGPTVSSHFWILDLGGDGSGHIDYTLTEILILEEITCPSVLVEIGGFKFWMPAYWNILVFDTESTEIDVVDIASAAGKSFHSVVYGPEASRIEAGYIKVVDYSQKHVNICPSLNKHQMLCHPISPSLWVNITPADVYNKYIKGKLTGDLA